jgi:hypothetical protein
MYELHAPKFATFAPLTVRRQADSALRKLSARRIGLSADAAVPTAGTTLVERDEPSHSLADQAPPLPPGSPIIFIHIPKTAGTAFSHYLTVNCGAPQKVMKAFYGDYSIYDGVTDAPVILGHTIYREMLARFPQASFVTWLRHPLQRVISQYKSWHNPKNLHAHWKEHAKRDHSFDHIYFTQNASFDEFVASKDTRLLNNITNTQSGILSSSNRSRFRREVLESAKENIEQNFKFFGIVERFDESIRVFKATFDWKAAFKDDDSTANRSERCLIEPSEQSIQTVMARNDLDMELYEFAMKLMDRRLAELDSAAKPADVASARRAA